jgi:hypothetical protein
MKSESEIQQLIMMEAPNFHNILLRNNSGALLDETGRLVRYGLGNASKKHNDSFKSSDLIGIRSLVVTEDMVGTVIGQFAAIEVKGEGWKFSEKDKRYIAQKAFIEWVRLRGGVAGFANSIEEYRKIIKSPYGI